MARRPNRRAPSISLHRLTHSTGVNGIYRQAARALSSHSLRVGLTQDLFAAGEDGIGIAQALRWSSPSTALRYGRKLAARSNVAARVLSQIRSWACTQNKRQCRPYEHIARNLIKACILYGWYPLVSRITVSP